MKAIIKKTLTNGKRVFRIAYADLLVKLSAKTAKRIIGDLYEEIPAPPHVPDPHATTPHAKPATGAPVVPATSP